MNINIVRPYLPNVEEIISDLSTCLETGMVTNNSQNVRKLEEDLHSFFNCELRPLLFCNGEISLFNLIQAVKLKLGYSLEQSFDVLVPSFTFSGTINAIVMNGLSPVFCDINETLTIDLDKCEELSDNIKMMIIVGSYGNLPDIDSVIEFSNRHGLYVIFDNAPAFASKFKDKYVCNYGFSEIYSFHASKIFNTMEGGCVVTSCEEIHENLCLIRDFGQYEKVRGNVKLPGLNSKMQEISAIVGLKNLQKIDTILENRKKNILKYKKYFESEDKVNFFSTMSVKENVECNYLYYPIILKEEATNFVNYLQSNGIMVRRYYTAVHRLDFYNNKYKNLNLDFTELIKDKIVSIPIHTIMSDEEINYIFSTINNYFKI